MDIIRDKKTKVKGKNTSLVMDIKRDKKTKVKGKKYKFIAQGDDQAYDAASYPKQKHVHVGTLWRHMSACDVGGRLERR